MGKGLCRGDDRRDLGGMVTIVLDHDNPIRLVVPLKPSFRTLKRMQAERNFRPPNAELTPHSNRCERIQDVVPARYRELQASKAFHNAGGSKPVQVRLT